VSRFDILWTMKDVTGKEIGIGDKIVFMRRFSQSGVDLHVGEVISFSPKMVRIAYRERHEPLKFKTSSYAPHNIAITDKVV